MCIHWRGHENSYIIRVEMQVSWEKHLSQRTDDKVKVILGSSVTDGEDGVQGASVVPVVLG